MAKRINFLDSSWSESCFSQMYNWWYPVVPGYSDNVLQSEIITTFNLVATELDKLSKVIGDNKKLVDEWRRRLNLYKRTISRDDAGAAFNELKMMLIDAKDLVRSSTSVKQSQAQVGMQSSAGPSSSRSTGVDVSDADLAAHYGHSKQTAKRRPPAVTGRVGVIVDAGYLWTVKQEKMLKQCMSITNTLSHEVNQEAVLKHLGLRTGVSIMQYQTDEAGTVPDLRIMKSGNATYWTERLTHQKFRDRGDFSVYKLDDNRQTFSYISGKRLKQDVTGT